MKHRGQMDGDKHEKVSTKVFLKVFILFYRVTINSNFLLIIIGALFREKNKYIFFLYAMSFTLLRSLCLLFIKKIN